MHRRGDVIAAVMVAMVILWMRILPGVLPPLNPELSPTEQFHQLLEHPLLLLTVMVNYFSSEWLWFSKTLVGYLGWTDTLLPNWYHLIAAGTLLMALLAPENRALIWWARMLAILTFVALVTLLSIALFMTWTPVGLTTIRGMQGRYLLGMLPLLAWAIPAYSSGVERALTSIWYPVLLFPLVTLVITPVAVMERYYGSWVVMVESLKALLL
ncbi:MAG: DUF2142 domain-containing protein [Deltaproteobacteria bacterium]|nr:DUF2142 domain-containing protein [Deltaproteobacteria bacterium]